MIQIIAGKKGSGKTKRLIDMTNQIAAESPADVVFLDDDDRYIREINHKARFVNAGWRLTARGAVAIIQAIIPYERKSFSHDL